MTATDPRALLVAAADAKGAWCDRVEELAGDVFEYHRGPWRTTPGPAGWSCVRATTRIEKDGEADTFVFQMDTTSTAAYIAAMNPAEAARLVAEGRAVAAWLRAFAVCVADDAGTFPAEERAALAAARAVLGHDTTSEREEGECDE